MRRPIVGFKRYERKVGVTGGYAVSVDWFRYEEGFLSYLNSWSGETLGESLLVWD